MKTKKLLIVSLAIIMLLAGLAPSMVQAAKTNPAYCRISYDSALKTNTLRYYSYNKKNISEEDGKRLVLFNGKGTIKLGTKQTIVTKKQKPGTNPGWNQDGSYLVWQEKDDCVLARNFKTGKVLKIAKEVLCINLNAETMVTSISFKDGSKKSLKSLLANSGNDPVTPGNGNTPPKPTPTPEPEPTPEPSISEIKEWVDSAGRHHFKFGKNEVIVDGAKIYLNEYRISDICNSGVRFIGIDTKNRIYLWEDSLCHFYRFNLKNIFTPELIKFPKGTKLKSIVTNKNKYMTKVFTSSGTYTIKQLVSDKTWYPKQNYAINKSGYCSYYLKNNGKTYILKLKSNKLYLNKKLVAKGITRKTDSFGFYKQYIRYVKGKNAYQAKISCPTKSKLWKKNVKKLIYSKSNGCVTTAK